MKQYFSYTIDEINALTKKEPKFAPYVKQFSELKREINPNVFESIIEAMIAQQISGKIATIIINRLIEKVKNITPQNLLLLTDEGFKVIGLGPQKRGYIRAISTSFNSGEVNEQALQKMSEEEVIQQLIKLKGVGEWTAEMLLIFSLGKRDILSFKDLGIRKGLMKLYRKIDINEITPEFFKICKEKFSPYNTLASFYLWEIASLKK